MISERRAGGDDFRIGVWTGASTAPELDGALAQADGIELRLPYQSDPISRAKINAGTMDYLDVHLSHVAQMAWEGFFGKLDVALVEVAGITEDGDLIPSTSVGNNKTWIDLADKVILEVNTQQPLELDGMHDIYYGTALPPHRRPLMIVRPEQRIGVPHLACPHDKIVAIVETAVPDRHTVFRPVDEDSMAIASHLIEFLEREVKVGRIPAELLPLQSGVDQSAFRGLTAYTEVLQDGMLDLLASGTIDFASATAFSLSPMGAARFNDDIAYFRNRILLRSQEISNHPEVIRRLA
jgi:succinyl-CoA:acetate CoA-transferase